MASSLNLFVTGGRGRLATLIARHYEASAHKVSLFSRQAGGGIRDLRELPDRNSLQQAGAILHLAWSTLPASAEANPESPHVFDLPFLRRLLESIVACPVERRPRLIFFSSGGTVYGNAREHPSRESDPTHPLGRYGLAKVAAEETILRAAEQHGIPFTILRISNPYGYPVSTARPQGIIPHAIRCAVHGQPLALWGDGSARKDYLYCEDFLSALTAVLERPLTGIFNVSAGRSHSVLEVLAEVEAQVGRKILLARAPASPWDVQDSRLDNAKLIAATGWRPKIDLAEGIRRETAGSVPP
ncbi:MAG TPA: NAD-dependent epimerase/dehydratase family protein [Candidatus Didemnitutus sp.]|nr:NAD-dependent epimerase/dehydratase family protein [Candidatus Didemnitutus sp.]